MNRVKICGLRREQDIVFANEIQPDFIGFVFAPSKRKVTAETARQLRALLRKDIPAVGVFVNAPEKDILELAKAQTIQLIQLHGQEDFAYIKRIKEQCALPIIKAVSVKKQEDIYAYQDSEADYLLFDQGNGGSGRVFDWSLLTGHLKKPFFLAGGISAENVQEAIRQYHPFAVDASSSVETDGVKDFEKMKQLTQLVHGTDESIEKSGCCTSMRRKQ